jgi:hypothetical protein
MRQNIIEDVWADIFGVDQSAISRIITFLTPLVEQATAEFRPTPEEAADATRDVIALVDGTLWPCWSWDGERKLWSGDTGPRDTALFRAAIGLYFFKESFAEPS